jgi:hypothetical protein
MDACGVWACASREMLPPFAARAPACRPPAAVLGFQFQGTLFFHLFPFDPRSHGHGRPGVNNRCVAMEAGSAKLLVPGGGGGVASSPRLHASAAAIEGEGH